MRFSIYTPTHDTRWLKDTYDSVRRQTFQDFEWLILPNGPGKIDFSTIPGLLDDPRVVILDHISSPSGIGSLKKILCERTRGEIFVELDHDDRLSSDCLEEIDKAAKKTPDSFYYSDCSGVYPNGAPEIFSNTFGWKQYEAVIDGEKHVCHRSFPASARSLCEIWYAPNHVRAWSRSAYLKSGGYNEKLVVADDHDLLCRTYIAGVEFVHIPKPLYIYRRIVDPRRTNTFASENYNKKIQDTQAENRDKYLYLLCAEWARRNGLLMLDLGGAHNKPKSYTSVDLHDADIIHDIAKNGIPCKDNEAGVLRAFDFIEHLPRDRWTFFMNDCYRALAPGGWIISATPSSDGRGAFQDPTHTNYINENSFWYFTDREYAKYVTEIRCRFQAVRLFTAFPSEFHRRYHIPYVYADLCAIKGFDHVGPIAI